MDLGQAFHGTGLGTGNELYIKKLGNGELVFHNPRYPPIRREGGFACIGEVLEKAMLV